jgi:hypothetical protein
MDEHAYVSCGCTCHPNHPDHEDLVHAIPCCTTCDCKMNIADNNYFEHIQSCTAFLGRNKNTVNKGRNW